MVDFSSLRDNHFDLAQSTEVFERILCGDDEVCTFSRLDRSGFGSDSCHLGGAGGCGVEREYVGNSDIFMEVKEFPPEVVLCNPRASDIVSKDNGDVVGDGFFRTVDDSLICGKDSRACLFSGFNFIAQPRIESSKPSDGADRSDTAQ